VDATGPSRGGRKTLCAEADGFKAVDNILVAARAAIGGFQSALAVLEDLQQRSVPLERIYVFRNVIISGNTRRAPLPLAPTPSESARSRPLGAANLRSLLPPPRDCAAAIEGIAGFDRVTAARSPSTLPMMKLGDEIRKRRESEPRIRAARSSQKHRHVTR